MPYKRLSDAVQHNCDVHPDRYCISQRGDTAWANTRSCIPVDTFNTVSPGVRISFRSHLRRRYTQETVSREVVPAACFQRRSYLSWRDRRQLTIPKSIHSDRSPIDVTTPDVRARACHIRAQTWPWDSRLTHLCFVDVLSPPFTALYIKCGRCSSVPGVITRAMCSFMSD